jgi:hypothetical protein
MRKLFEALFALLRKFAPVLIAILIVMLAVWVTMCTTCLGEEEPAPVEVEEPVEQPGLAHDTEPMPLPAEGVDDLETIPEEEEETE